MTTPVPVPPDSAGGSEGTPRITAAFSVYDTVAQVARGLPASLPALLPMYTTTSGQVERILAQPLFPIAGPGPASGVGGFQPPRDRRMIVYGP